MNKSQELPGSRVFFMTTGPSVQSPLQVRRSPSVSENSLTQVRPRQASMHSTKSLPLRATAASLQTARLTCCPGKQRCPPGRPWSPGSSGRCPHLETTHSTQRQCPFPCLASDAVRTQQAEWPGGFHWLDPILCTHFGIWLWGKKNPWPLRATLFPEGSGCSPKPADS